MEKKLTLYWEINLYNIGTEERYCHNCGKKVIFTDSLKRRQNANGKNIFHYAIYKCPNGHTWNKILNIFKATSGLENLDEKINIKENQIDAICIENIRKEGYNSIEININNVTGNIRLDKLLSNQIVDMSRSKIEQSIKSGDILINGKMVKPKKLIKNEDKIMLTIINPLH